jgi:hypothetical protein
MYCAKHRASSPVDTCSSATEQLGAETDVKE